MKYLFLIFLSLFFFIPCGAQKTGLPDKKYEQVKMLREQWRVNRNRLGLGQLEFGVQSSHFYNEAYHLLRTKELIKAQPGFRYRFQLSYYPCLFSVEVFESGYDIDEAIVNNSDDNEVSYRGVGGSFGLVLFPYSSWSKYITPTIGVGYQLTELCRECEDSRFGNSENERGEMLWNAGLLIHLGKRFYIRGEYTQSITLILDANYTTSIALGIKLSKLKNIRRR